MTDQELAKAGYRRHECAGGGVTYNDSRHNAFTREDAVLMVEGEAMKMKARPTEDILREKGWTQVIDDYADITYKHPVHGNDWTEEGALKMASIPDDPAPAPRPTCGTCPMWDAGNKYAGTEKESCGECRLAPTIVPRFRYHWCGQHPDMAEWIAKWWKVKR